MCKEDSYKNKTKTFRKQPNRQCRVDNNSNSSTRTISINSSILVSAPCPVHRVMAPGVRLHSAEGGAATIKKVPETLPTRGKIRHYRSPHGDGMCDGCTLEVRQHSCTCIVVHLQHRTQNMSAPSCFFATPYIYSCTPHPSHLRSRTCAEISLAEAS